MLLKFRIGDNIIKLNNINSNILVSDVKKKLCEKNSDLLNNDLKLIFKGVILKDDKTLSDNNILNNSVIHVIVTKKVIENYEVNIEDIKELVNDINFLLLLKNKKFYNIIKKYVDNPELINDDKLDNKLDVNNINNKLNELHKMGFMDDDKNVLVLNRCDNMEDAINILLND